jgi:hypothetical protein
MRHLPDISRQIETETLPDTLAVLRLLRHNAAKPNFFAKRNFHDRV